MAKHTANFPNFQQRALEFSVGDKVCLFGESSDLAGRVVAVYPAIGMVDVDYPHGETRLPVEDLQRLSPKSEALPPVTDNTVASTQSLAERVAKAFVKQSLYWGARNRKYRAKQSEVDSGVYLCPKCTDQVLKKAVYKREEDEIGSGRSVRLLGCPNCMFLIKECDIIGHPSNLEMQEEDCEGEVL